MQDLAESDKMIDRSARAEHHGIGTVSLTRFGSSERERRTGMKVIFCDVDGVLNNAGTTERSPGGCVGVSGELIGNLRKIVAATGARIILSSDWRLVRNHPERKKDYRYLVIRLRITASLTIDGHTDDIRWNRRGHEIRKYLKDHPEIKEYVILDDLPFRDFAVQNLLPHLVLTDPEYGLTDEDARKAIRILSGEHRVQQGRCPVSPEMR